MQREQETSALKTMLRVLYQPVPYLPEMSFLERGRSEQRKRQAMAKLKEKGAQERKVRGNIELLSKGKCKICGHTVEITDSTWVFGDIKNGAVAEMTLLVNGENFTAKRVVVL